MFSDEDLLPLSALQHYVFCSRQCALIHLEQQWVENRFTAEGRAMHDRVDRPEHEVNDGVRVEYAVMLRSLRLGLIGKADVVEFHPPDETQHFKSQISDFKPSERTLCVFPVEYKRGRPKPDHCDHVQLCAQALCLEEMLSVEIPSGAVFYGKPRRRQKVDFSASLRSETVETARALHSMIAEKKTPPPIYEKKKCTACSLFDICMPQTHRRVSAYLADALSESSNLKSEIPQSGLRSEL